MVRAIRNGKWTGFLFLLTYVSFLGGAVLINRIQPLADPFASLRIGGEASLFAAGIFLELICGFGIVGIPLLLSGLVKEENRSLNLTYLSFRMAEAGVIFLSSILLMTLIPLSRTGLFHDDELSLIRAVYRGINDYWIPITLGSGGFFYNFILYREKFVPPLFSFWGMIGYPLTAVGGILEAFGIHMGTYLALPIALYELVFAVYLLINGYGSSYISTTKGEER